MWPHNKPLPDFFFCVQSYDTAFTSKTENDPTGCQVWGVFEHEKRRNVLLLDCWNEHLDYPALKAKVMEDWGAKYGGVKNDPMKPSRKPDEIIIEEKGSGISLIQDLRRANIPIFSYNPGRADKVARAYMITPIIEGDVVWVMESKREPGRPISWARPMLTQLEQFPNGEHDEMSDCISQALARLRDLQQLDYDVVPDDEEVDRDYHENARRAVNPYA
jgi:predicted phage terminase large subunit-like protein